MFNEKMKDFSLQIQSQDSVQSSLSENVSTFVEKINPLQLPHETFVTDLAIIMILAAVVTLAFFKIRQPLIIGYLFAGMLIGPLSPLWTSFLPANGGSASVGGISILSDISALNLFADIGVILLLFVIGIELSLIHISEPTRPEPISYAVFCLKKKKMQNQ